MSQSQHPASQTDRPPMRVIGTAGHVDHGKSTLVHALTGIDPDRLAEEKARAMTIDLGFAWLTLPNEQTVGVVDVPGHRDFIENMLAGIDGIDLVLLVIAADEGMMPQTREHLAIIDLLGIQHGIVVLTKTDLIDDPDWLSLIQEDIRTALASTSLAGVQILPVSARTGFGINVLKHRIAAALADLPPRPNIGAPRLPIDRVFTMSGFGTIVTGTLANGSLHVGALIELFPDGLTGRVRGLQSYKQSLNVVYPGSRVAVNISGIDHTEIRRGMVLGSPKQFTPTKLIDVRFRYLHDLAHPLKHNTQVKLFVGAAEINAHVRLLDSEQLAPGEEGWLQLRLESPAAVARGDRFILRRPSPAETIGGGIVVDSHPALRWKRFSSTVISALETRLQGTPAQGLAQAAHTHEPVKRAALQKLVGYSNADFELALENALTEGLIIEFTDGTLLSLSRTRALHAQINDELIQFHHGEPLKLGMPREALRSRLGIKQAALNVLLETTDGVVQEGSIVRRADHAIRFTDAQQAAVVDLLQRMTDAPYTPPAFTEAAALVGEDVLHALLDHGDIIQVQSDVIFTRAAYDEMVRGVLDLFNEHTAITASQLRDRFATSRKYAIALLEHLDTLGITRREGDTRVRGRNAP